MNINDINLNELLVFISGPMRGYPNYNFKKFDEIENRLKSVGIRCINPAHISRQYKEKDILNDTNMFLHMINRQQAAQKTCNAILLLDGWQWSGGVMLEMKTAMNCGHRVLLESDLAELEKKKLDN